jgi:phosphoserine aminotransferase
MFMKDGKKSAVHPALIGSLTPSDPSATLCNLSPGPTSLPREVEEEIAASFRTPGLTSLALSHRAPEFQEILDHAVASARRVMDIPDDYVVLFTHAGGHGQFAAVPLNLCHDETDVATYVVNGTWSERARDEASAHGYATVHTIDGKDAQGEYTTFPTLTEEDIDPRSKFVYLCSNETVNGVELFRLPQLPRSRRHIPLVVDASSDFTTKPIDWHGNNVGVLFACASKNIGHPGVTLTVVRKDLLGNSSRACPGVFDYTVNAEAGNLWNTIPTFNVEVVGRVMDWIGRQGGVPELERRSIAKSKLIYDVIDGSDGFYGTPVDDRALRSRMNVPFNVKGGDEERTDRFLIEAHEKGFVGLRTLTPFGAGKYLRASLYNAITENDAARLADFMRSFALQSIANQA